jgi:acetyl esterase/lipase
MQRRALLTGLSGLLTACASPLGAFNALAPRDGAGQRIAEGLAYGEGPRRRLDIYAPAAPGPRPVIIFFYGGSWNSGRRQDYAFAGAAFAARGFVTVIPDYRLVPETRFPASLRIAQRRCAGFPSMQANMGATPRASFWSDTLPALIMQ